MKTDKMVDQKGLTRSGDIKDPYVVSFCASQIKSYIEKINKEDVSAWDIKTLIEYMERTDEDVCFSDYARKYKREMETVRGMARNAKNYELAYNHLERFAGTNKLMFSRFTTKFINDWIKSMMTTSRAKENLRGWTFCYNRAKTMKFRRDKAYLKLEVPELLRPIMEKHFSEEGDEYLFRFHKIYCDDDSFNANMNNGLRRICKHDEIDGICMYNFRHSWGTIARNDIKAPCMMSPFV